MTLEALTIAIGVLRRDILMVHKGQALVLEHALQDPTLPKSRRMELAKAFAVLVGHWGDDENVATYLDIQREDIYGTPTQAECDPQDLN